MNSYFIPDEVSEDFQSQQQNELPVMGSETTKEKEDILPYILRNVSRSVSRAGEQVLGQPGNIAELLSNLRSYGQPKENEPEGYLERVKAAFAKPGDPFSNLALLPTSKEIRSGIKYFTDYLEPKTTGEEKFDDFIQKTTNFVLPTRFLGAGAGLGTALAAAGLGMGTEDLLKSYGVSPGAAKLWGGGAEIATLMRSDAPAFVRSMMNRVRRSAPRAGIDKNNYVNALEELITDFERGGVSEAERKAYNLSREQLSRATGGSRLNPEQLTALEEQIANFERYGGSESDRRAYDLARQQYEAATSPLQLDELVALRDNINQQRFKETALGQFVLDERARVHLNKLDELVNNNIDTFLQNPETSRWVQDYRRAQGLAQIIHNSNRVARNISKKIRLDRLENFEPETLQLFGSEVGKGLGGKFKSIFGPALIPVAKSAQFATRFSGDPLLRRYYAEVMQQGLRGYTGEAIKSLNKFDAQLKKSKRKEQFIEQTESKTKKQRPAETDYFIPD